MPEEEQEIKELPIKKILDMADQEARTIHPSIDYHNSEGFYSMGTPLSIRGESQTLVITEDSYIVKYSDGSQYCSNDKISSFGIPLVKSQSKSDLTSFVIRNITKDFDKNDRIEIEPNLTEIYNRLHERTQYYWYHEEPWQIFTTCWIIGTYFHQLFSVFPHYFISGERQSGKSTVLQLFRNFAWNPTEIQTNLRPAPMFRKFEIERPTHLADVTKISEHQVLEVGDVYEAGAEKGGTVPRCVGENNRVVDFPVYNPKALACRENVPFAPKGIELKSVRPDEDAVRKFTERREQLVEGDPNREVIVEKLMRATLTRWEDVLEAYESIDQSGDLVGRIFRMFRSILAIAKVFAPKDDFEKLVNKAHEYAKEGVRAADEMSIIENAVLRVLVDKLAGTDEMSKKQVGVLYKDLAEGVKEDLNWRNINPNQIYSALSNMGILQTRSDTKEGKKYWINNKKFVSKVTDRNIVEKGELKESEELNEAQEKIIDSLKFSGPLSASDLIDKTGLSREQAKENTKLLYEQGIVSKAKGKGDKLLFRLEEDEYE